MARSQNSRQRGSGRRHHEFRVSRDGGRCLLHRSRGGVAGACSYGSGVEAKLLEELAQGHARDADAKGPIDKVDQVGTAGVGMVKEELGNRPGLAWQEFAVGPSIQTVMGLANRFLGREPLLA